MFIFYENKKLELLREINERMKITPLMNVHDEMQFMMMYLHDLVFLEHGVEVEQMMTAFVELGVEKDPEIKNLMKENMKQYPPNIIDILSKEIITSQAHDTEQLVDELAF